MNRFCSIFSQLLQLFSRADFQLAVKETKAEPHARGFSCWPSSWPWSFANWAGLIPSAKLLVVFEAARES